MASSALACSIVNKFYKDKLKRVLDEHESLWSGVPQELKDSLPESFQRMLRNDKLDARNFFDGAADRKPPLRLNPVKHHTCLLAGAEPSVHNPVTNFP